MLDCGQAVNPDIVRSQMEGGVIYGLTAALYGGLNLVNGAIKESNFHDYPMLRMNESPEIEVIIIDEGTEHESVSRGYRRSHQRCQCSSSHWPAPTVIAASSSLTL